MCQYIEFFFKSDGDQVIQIIRFVCFQKMLMSLTTPYQCTLYTVHCTKYSVQWKLYSVQYKPYSVQWKLYSVQCKLYSVQCSPPYTRHGRSRHSGRQNTCSPVLIKYSVHYIAVDSLLCKRNVKGTLCTDYSIYIYSVACTVYTLTVSSVHGTMYLAQCTVFTLYIQKFYSAQCTVLTV